MQVQFFFFFDAGTIFNAFFTDGITEAQSGYVTCPESHS